MFIEQGIKPENKFWKYLLGSLLIFIASQIGSLPLVIAVGIKSFKNGEMPTNTDDIIKMLDPNLSLFLMLLMFVFGLIALYFVVKKLHNQTILSVTTSRKKVDWSRIFFSFSLWAIITIVSTLIAFYYGDGKLILDFNPEKFAVLAVIAIVLLPIQTTTEEYIFRGYLMQGFANLERNRWFPLLMTSVIFGTMHILNPEVSELGNIVLVYYIGTGLFLGIMTLMDEGMELALGFHAANNLIGALLVSTDWTVLKTYAIFKDTAEPSAGFETIFLPIFIMFPIILFIFSKKYKWNNWKDKLTGNLNTFTLKKAYKND